MFICFEGLAGTGKTTQCNILANYLRNTKEDDVFVSAVYEDNKRKVISEFLNTSGIYKDQNAVMFLFQALHCVQYQEALEALSENKIVIADRWRYSFFAHHLNQGTFNGDSKIIYQLDNLAFRDLKPDFTILLQLPYKTAYDRYVNRERSTNDKGLALMDLEYFRSVSDYYSEIANKNKWYIIDASGDEKTVSHRILDAIKTRL